MLTVLSQNPAEPTLALPSRWRRSRPRPCSRVSRETARRPPASSLCSICPGLFWKAPWPLPEGVASPGGSLERAPIPRPTPVGRQLLRGGGKGESASAVGPASSPFGGKEGRKEGPAHAPASRAPLPPGHHRPAPHPPRPGGNVTVKGWFIRLWWRCELCDFCGIHTLVKKFSLFCRIDISCRIFIRNPNQTIA